MRNIEYRYIKIKVENPGWSTYTCLAHTVKGKNYRDRQIRKWFFKLVDIEDFEEQDIPALLSHLRSLTKLVEDDSLEGSICPTFNENESTLTYYYLPQNQITLSK